jgi:excisionase family DNA binding protein
MENYLTVLEVAAIARVDKQTVYRWIWAGDLPRIPIGTGKKPRLRIRQSAVERFMTSREKGGKAA